MPKKKRTPEQVEAVRSDILSHAVALFVEEGFTGFSMRKLASRLGVAVVTIYSYFRNKDDLYLAIVVRGLSMLSERMNAKVACADLTPLARVRALITAYVDFGLDEPHIYSLMFTLPVPKYHDYVGTPIEQSALNALIEGVKVVNIFRDAERELVKNLPAEAEDFALMRLAYFWIILHGFVSSYNSRSLQYIYSGKISMKEQVINEVMKGIEKDVALAASIEGRSG